MKVDQILSVGQRFECVQNTYRPELDGTMRTAMKVGAGVLAYHQDEGVDGYSSGLTFRDNQDGTYTTPLKRVHGHTLTIRPLAGAENERLKAERISADNVIRETLSELGGEPCDDPVLLARKVVASIERLRCCGNCGYENEVWGSCDDDVDEELPDSGAVAPHNPCHFVPSRWTERSTP